MMKKASMSLVVAGALVLLAGCGPEPDFGAKEQAIEAGQFDELRFVSLAENPDLDVVNGSQGGQHVEPVYCVTTAAAPSRDALSGTMQSGLYDPATGELLTQEQFRLLSAEDWDDSSDDAWVLFDHEIFVDDRSIFSREVDLRVVFDFDGPLGRRELTYRVHF